MEARQQKPNSTTVVKASKIFFNLNFSWKLKCAMRIIYGY